MRIWLAAMTLLFCVLCLTSAPVPAAATLIQQAELTELAERLPPVDVFASIRTDAGSIAALDAVLLRLSRELPAEVAGPLTVSGIIASALGLEGLNLDVAGILTTLTGDTLAVGLDLDEALTDGSFTQDDALGVYVVTPVKNRSLLEGVLILSGLLRDAAISTEGAFTVYALAGSDTVLALSDNELRIAVGGVGGLWEPAPAMADAVNFGPTMQLLPAADHLAMFYVGTGQLARSLRPDPAVQEILTALGLPVDTLGPLAAGFRISDDGRTLVVDVVQERELVVLNPSAEPDPEFARYVPDDAEVFIHTTDINRLLGTVSGLVASLSGSTTRDDIYRQIENLVSLLLDLNLQTDILPWASGNYGFVADIPGAADLTAEGLRVGALLEVTETAGAQSLVNALAETVERLTDDNTHVTPARIVDAVTSNSVEAFIVGIEDANLGLIELAFGVYENLLFIATYEFSVALLQGGAPLLDSPVYQATRSAMLPQAELSAYFADRVPGNVAGLLFQFLEPLRLIVGEATADLITQLAPEFFVNAVSSSGLSALTSAEGDLVLRLSINLEGDSPEG